MRILVIAVTALLLFGCNRQAISPDGTYLVETWNLSRAEYSGGSPTKVIKTFYQKRACGDARVKAASDAAHAEGKPLKEEYAVFVCFPGREVRQVINMATPRPGT